MDSIDITTLVVIITGCFIFSPVLLYALYCFHKIRTVQIMKFRDRTLIYLINILVLSAIIFEGLLICSTHIWHLFATPQWNTCDVVHIPFIIWYIYLLFAIKTWLLYFEQRYHLSLINLTWKKLINQYTKSWHINARSKYGNYKYLLKIGLIPFAFCISIKITLRISLQRSNCSMSIQTLSAFINWFLNALPLLFAVAIYYRFDSRGFRDIYKISTEIKYQCIIIILCLLSNIICLVAITIYVHYNNMNTDTDIDIKRIYLLLDLIFAYILLFGIAAFTTMYPVAVYNKQLNTNRLARYQDRNMANDHKYNRKKMSSIRQMAVLIKNIRGFKTFMLHLLQEFSTENLVFLVELIQIKYAFQQRNNNIILVPKRPIFEAEKSATNPSFDAVIHSNSVSSSRDSGGTDLRDSKYGADMLEIVETGDRKQSLQSTSSITPNTHITEQNNTPQHSNNNSNDTDHNNNDRDIYEDNDKYMVLDFNAIGAMQRSNSIERSPSPSPAPQRPLSEDTSAAFDELSADMSHTQNDGQNIIPTASMPKLPNSIFLQRSRSRSKIKAKRKKQESMYSYLFHNNGSVFMKLELPPGLPRSAVLSDAETSSNLALEMEYLYHKFVAIRSVHEINLSHVIHTPLIHFFEKKLHLKQKYESFLFNVFDEAAQSILELMLDSYHRFILTEKFKSISMDFSDVSINNKEIVIAPQTNTPSVNENVNMDLHDNDNEFDVAIIRKASSFNKLVIQYNTNN